MSKQIYEFLRFGDAGKRFINKSVKKDDIHFLFVRYYNEAFQSEEIKQVEAVLCGPPSVGGDCLAIDRTRLALPQEPHAQLAEADGRGAVLRVLRRLDPHRVARVAGGNLPPPSAGRAWDGCGSRPCTLPWRGR